MSHHDQTRPRHSGLVRRAIFVGLQVLAVLVFSARAGNVLATGKPSETLDQTNSPITATRGSQDLRLLEPGKPIKEELAGGQARSYRLALTAGQYVYVVVEQHGIDVVVTLFGPDGKEMVKIDSPNGTEGPEPVWAVAETSGDYRLEVGSPDNTVQPGRYEVRIEELRAATPQDRGHVAGIRALAEAQQLAAAGADEQSLRKAVAKYEEALRGWQAARDPQNEGLTLLLTGMAYTSLYNPQKALENYYKALDVAQPLGNSQLLATILSQIGSVYDSPLNDQQRALEYYEKALPIFEKLPDRVSEAILLNNIGHLYNDVRKPEQAMECFKRALPVYEQPGRHLPGEAILRDDI